VKSFEPMVQTAVNAVNNQAGTVKQQFDSIVESMEQLQKRSLALNDLVDQVIRKLDSFEKPKPSTSDDLAMKRLAAIEKNVDSLNHVVQAYIADQRAKAALESSAVRFALPSSLSDAVNKMSDFAGDVFFHTNKTAYDLLTKTSIYALVYSAHAANVSSQLIEKGLVVRGEWNVLLQHKLAEWGVPFNYIDTVATSILAVGLLCVAFVILVFAYLLFDSCLRWCCAKAKRY